MKKIIAVLLTSTFIIGTAVAQTGTAPAAKPADKKEATAKPAEKKDAMGTSKPEGKMKHHKGGGKGGMKKAEAPATPKK